MRRLIINADDFGLTAGVNRAIVEAHGRGVVTSATLMSNAAAFEDAVQKAATAPKLSVGCHVILVDGSPLLSATQLPTLVASNTTNGLRFRESLGSFAASAILGRLDPEQIEAEATSQMRKLQSAGITVSHFDTHKHTHMFPSVLRPLLQAAKACGIKAVRNPFTPWLPISLIGSPRVWKRYLEVRALHGLAGTFCGAVQRQGMLTPDGTFGIVATGALDLDFFQRIVGHIPEGTWEFVCHPGYNDAELQAVKTRLRESRVKELTVLTSTAAREALSQSGIELISYQEFVACR
ncbi:MAG TPA: ChbG/HpnK family deacetylase [Terriglobales bacterium]|nr:ChbG/HpnK family deacetylase [Terriglobales bacterium]